MNETLQNKLFKSGWYRTLNMQKTLEEFDKRYKYCVESLNEYYSISTCDLKSPEYYAREWGDRRDNIKKVISQLELCIIDARYIEREYKKLIKINE